MAGAIFAKRIIVKHGSLAAAHQHYRTRRMMYYRELGLPQVVSHHLSPSSSSGSSKFDPHDYRTIPRPPPIPFKRHYHYSAGVGTRSPSNRRSFSWSATSFASTKPFNSDPGVSSLFGSPENGKALLKTKKPVSPNGPRKEIVFDLGLRPSKDEEKPQPILRDDEELGPEEELEGEEEEEEGIYIDFEEEAEKEEEKQEEKPPEPEGEAPGGDDPDALKGGFEATITIDEACQILGLELGGIRDPKTIQTAHRRVMLRNHPDRGGSPYIATKINEAKEFLLSQDPEELQRRAKAKEAETTEQAGAAAAAAKPEAAAAQARPGFFFRLNKFFYGTRKEEYSGGRIPGKVPVERTHDFIVDPEYLADWRKATGRINPNVHRGAPLRDLNVMQEKEPKSVPVVREEDEEPGNLEDFNMREFMEDVVEYYKEEEAERLENERLALEKAEKERIEKEKMEMAKLEYEKLEAAKLEAEKLETAKLETASKTKSKTSSS